MTVHIPAEDDDSSLEGSDSGSRGVNSFINFGYAAARIAAMNEKDLDELDDIDHDGFFPPPPKGPPPEPPDSDDDSNSSDLVPSDYEEGEESPEVYRKDEVEISSSPSDSMTGSTDQLVTGFPTVSSPNGFLRRFSLTEATTEL